MVRISFLNKIELDMSFNIPEQLRDVMDINELQALVSVVQTGSLTESAKALNLPKSTMSRRLKILEEHLGQALLRRESNGLIPTEAGYLFYRYALDIVKMMDNGKAALDELQDEVSGELSLSCHDALIRSWFAPLVSRFIEAHPELRVNLRSQLINTDQIELDGLSIWVGQEPQTMMRCECIGTLEQKLYAHPDYLDRYGRPSKPTDLASHKWIDVTQTGIDSLTFSHPLHGEQSVTLPSSRLMVDRLVLQGDAISRGAGLGLLPTWIAGARLRHHPDIYEICLPEWKGPELGVYMVYPHGQLSRKMRRFIRYIRESIPMEWVEEYAPSQHVA
jgi:DNA-binding transcriptional LysR family regulator